MSVDNVVPVSRWREFGVRRMVLDNDSNRMPACLRCNSEKGTMSPGEWFDLHPEYKKRFKSRARYLSDAIRRIVGMD
jgi:hypothetical protein